MFGGKFQNVWREAKKWQRRGASFFVDRIPYGKFNIFRNLFLWPLFSTRIWSFRKIFSIFNEFPKIENGRQDP